MKVMSAAVSLLLLSMVAGCSSLTGVPSASSFQSGSLKKAKSAEHWNIIARDVTSQAVSAIAQHPSLQGKLLFVDRGSAKSDFSQGFNSLLTSNLVNSGLAVSTKPDGAAKVTFDAQVVRHEDSRKTLEQPGILTALTGGILVARQIDQSKRSQTAKVASTVGLIAAADIGSALVKLNSATNTEVIVTTSIIYQDQYVLRKSDVYYVEDADGVLFDDVQTKLMKVVGE